VQRIKKYKVHWTSIALTDLRKIAQYIFEDAPGQADAVLHRMDAVAESLETMPVRGRLVPELIDSGKQDYREIIIAPWRVIYRVSGDDVFISAVLDGRRNLKDLLLRSFSAEV
jgi:addiction module RelE/StbE family toxin